MTKTVEAVATHANGRNTDLLLAQQLLNYSKCSLFSDLAGTDRIEAINHVGSVDLLHHCLETGEKIARTEWVTLSQIDTDGDLIVDTAHADELGEVMVNGAWGITQAAMLQAAFNQINATVVYRPIDGYHRIVGLGRKHAHGLQARMKAEVLYGCTDAEMYDQRILAANSVKSVKFARVCTWMHRAWEATPWKDLISVAQAFGMATFKSSGKQLLGEDPQVAEQIIAWCQKKADIWLAPISTIHANLRTYELADPELVLKVRMGSAFVKGEVSLTATQLGAVASAFPYSEFPFVQQEIMRFALGHNLDRGQLEELIADAKTLASINGASLQMLFMSDKWRERKTEKTKKKKLREQREKQTRQERLKALVGAILGLADMNEEALIKLLEHADIYKVIEEPEEETVATIQQHIATLVEKLMRNEDLSASLKRRLAAQTADMVHQIRAETTFTAEAEHIQRAEKFIGTWDKASLYNKLAKDKSAREQFQQEIAELDAGTMYLVMEYFADCCVSRRVNERDMAIAAFEALPLPMFNSEFTTRILDIFESALAHIDVNAGADEVSAIVESFVEVVMRFDVLAVSVPVAWMRMLKSLLEITHFADPKCRTAICNWAARYI